MASFFEPEAFLLDPTSHFDDSPSSFLSFSSFADFTSIKSPFSFPSWGSGSSEDHQQSKESLENTSSSCSYASDSVTSSPPTDPFQIIEAAFEPSTPLADIGIFVDHTPSSSKAGPSKLSASSDGQSSSGTLSYRSTSSSESWDTPHTPGLTTKSSTDSFASSSHSGPYTPSPFSWDDASTSLGGSSSYSTTPYTPLAHRTTSNPSLGSASRPRVPKPMASMPSLKEEDNQSTSAWFDGTDFGSIDVLNQAQNLGQGVSNLEVTDDVLAEDFEWVFGDYGLGVGGGSSDSVPPESTIFAAFHSDDNQPIASSSSNPIPTIQTSTDGLDTNWLTGGTSMQDVDIPPYDFTSIANMPSFTIDPMAVMAPNAGLEHEEPSRPSSAPGFNEGKGSGQMLSVPMGDSMMRSISSDGLSHQRHAPPRDLFSYTPQQIPAGPPAPQPLYTTEPSPSFSHYPRAMPPTPSHNRRLSQSHGLSVQINAPMYSTYSHGQFPPTPQSATFGDPFLSSQSHAQSQPIMMTRAGTQPLPMTRKLSSGMESSSLPDTSNMPAHLVRAQAIVQMQEAKEEAQRQEMRRQSASRRVGMAQASVMQPHYVQHQQQQPLHQHHQQQQQQQFHQQPRHQTIMGWEGPSAQTASLPVLTTTPLVTIHPPPAQYSMQPGLPTTPHRVHPPPHSGVSSRPIARLPPSPTRTRKVSNSPSKRSPSGKKRQAMAPGGFSWGEATFINFTSDDAEKLLTGVAPSGSQSKRKREEDALMMKQEDEDRERSKRSRSDD